MLSCLWCTSSRKSSTPPGSLGTPWSGQVLKWYCQTVLSVFPWKEDANMWKQNPSDQNPAKSICVAKLSQIGRWHIQPAAQYPQHHTSQRREQARVLPGLTSQSHHLLPQLPLSHAVVSNNISSFTFRSHGKVLSKGDQQQGTFICHTHHSHLVALTLCTSSHSVPSHGHTNLIHPAYLLLTQFFLHPDPNCPLTRKCYFHTSSLFPSSSFAFLPLRVLYTSWTHTRPFF